MEPTAPGAEPPRSAVTITALVSVTRGDVGCRVTHPPADISRCPESGYGHFRNVTRDAIPQMPSKNLYTAAIMTLSFPTGHGSLNTIIHRNAHPKNRQISASFEYRYHHQPTTDIHLEGISPFSPRLGLPRHGDPERLLAPSLSTLLARPVPTRSASTRLRRSRRVSVINQDGASQRRRATGEINPPLVLLLNRRLLSPMNAEWKYGPVKSRERRWKANGRATAKV